MESDILGVSELLKSDRQFSDLQSKGFTFVELESERRLREKLAVPT
jgi:hypothetical protein